VDPDGIHISARRLEEKKRSNEGVTAELRVPAGAVLDLHTSNGAVHSTGGTGSVKVRTANGAIHIKDSKGPLHLHTSNGAVIVTGVSGTVELRTSNGRITVNADKAKINAHTSNGSIAFTGSLADGEHSFKSSNGSISLTLPADAQFKVDARTSHGRITTDFGQGPVKGSRLRLQATIGDKPAATVNLETSNGSIELRKKNKQASE
jgi:DUF4097 and DUF4098 domain-containing protein YvlB